MAVLLAAIMTMAMAVTAFADETTTTTNKTGTLTVKVSGSQTNLKGQTISLYKLFDVTRSGENYGYKVNSKYKTALQKVLKLDASATDDAYYEAVSKLTETAEEGATSTIQQFANAFTTELLTEDSVAKADYSSEGTEFTANNTSYDFENVEYGYYLVFQNDSKTIQSSLVTVDSDKTEVVLKSEAPSIEKKANVPTVKIGQTVTYTITGAVPDMTGYDNYVYKIHDTLTDGLDFVTNEEGTKVAVTVQIAGEDTDITAADFVDGSGNTSGKSTRSMVLDLSNAVKGKKTGDKIEVTYQATVNENAEVTTNNSATLEYSNNPGTNLTGTSEPSKVVTPTYPLNIKKIAKDAESIALAGAKFSLYKNSVAEENLIKVVKDANDYRVAKESEKDKALSEFVSTDAFTDGGYNLHVNGLEAGTYYLVETQAPDGYNKLSESIKVVITKESDIEWTVSQNDANKEDKIITVKNSTGSVLPKTGGKGTIAFAVVAVLLILGVAVSFMNDKRKAKH